MNCISYIVSIFRCKITSRGLTKLIRFPSCEVRVNCNLSKNVVFNGTKFKFSIKYDAYSAFCFSRGRIDKIGLKFPATKVGTIAEQYTIIKCG